jgi:hypothetical protein
MKRLFRLNKPQDQEVLRCLENFVEASVSVSVLSAPRWVKQSKTYQYLTVLENFRNFYFPSLVEFTSDLQVSSLRHHPASAPIPETHFQSLIAKAPGHFRVSFARFQAFTFSP